MERTHKNHSNDCYFCMININEINPNNHSNWTYPDLVSAGHLVPHSEEVLIPLFYQLPEFCEEKFCLSDPSDTNEDDCDYEVMSSIPQCFNQDELNDLTRDLNLVSRMNEKNLLKQETKITFYPYKRKRVYYPSSFKKTLVFCNEIRGLSKNVSS